MERVSRRQLITEYGLPAAIGLLGLPVILGGDSQRTTQTHTTQAPIPPTQPPVKEVPVEPTDTALVAEVFQRYGIELIAMTVMDPDTQESADFKYPRWTTERVQMLLSFLSYDNGNGLPPSYYQPDSRGYLRIALTVKDDPSQCCGEFTPGPHRDTRDVKLSLDHYDLSDPLNAYRDLAHELTHNQTYIRQLITETPDEGNTITFTTPESKPFFTDISRILGMTPPMREEVPVDGNIFFQYILSIQKKDPTAFMKRLEKEHGLDLSHKVTLAEEKEKLGRDWEVYSFTDHYFYGLTDIREFIAVMGENYAYGGETYFIKNYGEYLGEEIATQLCSYMKEHFFQGWTPPWSEAEKPPFNKAA